MCPWYEVVRLGADGESHGSTGQQGSDRLRRRIGNRSRVRDSSCPAGRDELRACHRSRPDGLTGARKLATVYRHDRELRTLIEGHLARFDVASAEHDGKAAAVALPVVEVVRWQE